jgi:tetratricopeptide (TPR) repeat protein
MSAKKELVSSVPTDNSEVKIPFKVMVGMPLYALVQGWENSEATPVPSRAVLLHSRPLLDTVKWLSPEVNLKSLGAAARNNDPRALATLGKLDGFLKQISETILQRCNQEGKQGDWAAVREEAGIAARIAGALEFRPVHQNALVMVARACWRQGDLKSTVATYEEAIQAAMAAKDKYCLAVVHDNLGLALADLGRLDEALWHYEWALSNEDRPEGRAAILSNKAGALNLLGEYRWAARITQDRLDELEQSGIGGKKLALALDNAGYDLMALGERAAALAMLERAQKIFEKDDLEGRLINALNRAEVHCLLKEKKEAAAAFQEAHDLAFENARRAVNKEHYRLGFIKGRAASLPEIDEVYPLFAEMIRAKEANEWQHALTVGQAAVSRAREAGDFMLTLRIDANAAAVLFEAGQADQAFKLANRVVSEASERGLARAEMMALCDLASLSASGTDIRQRMGLLSSFARCVVLSEVQREIAEGLNLDPGEILWESPDTGALYNQLARQAESYDADEVAIQYYKKAIEIARQFHAPQLANRLAGLRNVLDRNGHSQDAARVADEIKALLKTADLPLMAQLSAHSALGTHFEHTDLAKAIQHRKQACAILEQLRLRVPPGTQRSDVDRQFPWLYQNLASVLRRSGDDFGAFGALQRAKGRRLIDALAKNETSQSHSAGEVMSPLELSTMLGQLGQAPTALIDLAQESDGLTAYILDKGHVRSLHVLGDVNNLISPDCGDVREREIGLLNLCRTDPLLRELGTALAAEGLERRPVLVVPDRGLQNLPLHILPVAEKPWCDRNAISYVPSASVLQFTKKATAEKVEALVAGDSQSNLPYAAAECEQIAALLGTTPLLGSKCTRAAIEEQLRNSRLDIVHLAVHGRGDPRRGGRASLWLATDDGSCAWTEFTALTAFNWRVELVVLSGCGTGVSGPLQGHQLVGTASAALEAGASSVLACLWPVSDEACSVFMIAFYKELKRRMSEGPIDLRIILDQARNGLRAWLGEKNSTNASPRRRDGIRELPSNTVASEPVSEEPFISDALKWGPFVLSGQPILHVACKGHRKSLGAKVGA